MKVTLREKNLSGGKVRLYLDFYPPIIINGKPSRREVLELFLYAKPKTENEREHNKETKILANSITAQRQLEIQAGIYGFSRRKTDADLMPLFRDYVEQQQTKSYSTKITYNCVLRHFETFSGGSVRTADFNETFCKDFKFYLEFKADLAVNTASEYFDKFRFIVKNLFENDLISVNPVRKVKGIKKQETQKEFLTLAELQQLARTETKFVEIKKAALFSALTGLRFSDIQKMVWSEIQSSDEQGGFYIRFKQKKTGGRQTLPISDEAAEILGTRGADDENVIADLKRWDVERLPDLMKKAGISRHITFHCFRHTFAVIQLAMETDIYTVSKLLGHKSLRSTQIYAKVLDTSKRKAINKISLK